MQHLALRYRFLVPLLGLLLLASSARADGRKLALVVGVNTYRANSDLPSLRHAAADAAALSAALRQAGFTVIEMSHDVAREAGKELYAPNLAYIRDQIDGLLSYPNLGADDAVLISLHGHGVQYDLLDDERNREPQFYFCPADATVSGITTANELKVQNNLLPLAELYASLGACQAATKLLIVDACRNDPTRSTIFKSTLASATLPKLPPPPGGMAAFFSCKANQRAIEDPDLKHGVFTHFLVEGLNGKADQPVLDKPGDGVITLAELTSFVANNTYAYVFEKYPGIKQSPDIKGEFDTNLPLARVLFSLQGNEPGEVREFGGDLKIRMCWCPPGVFRMGSPKDEIDAMLAANPGLEREIFSDEEQREVALSHGYWLGQTEVTQGLWQDVMGTTPWVEHGDTNHYRAGTNYPAVCISHGLGFDGKYEEDSATDFCRKLTARERAAGRLPGGWSYQLPTEAQWEYACRAGTTGPYNGDGTGVLSDYAWYDQNMNDTVFDSAHAVGLKKANRWGLYDMHGNVAEWCQGIYERDMWWRREPGLGADVFWPVFRGGCAVSSAEGCRSANRDWNRLSYRFEFDGFRLALSRSED